MDTFASVKIGQGACDIDGETDSESPWERLLRILDVCSQISSCDVFRDDLGHASE
jgi:hypothetical protein